MKFRLIFVLGLLLLVPLFFSKAFAQSFSGQETKEEVLEARVNRVIEEKEKEVMGVRQLYQKLELLITKGSLENSLVEVENGTEPMAQVVRYQKGDQVVVSRTQGLGGEDFFYITDYVRRGSLFSLFLVFLVLAIGVAGWRGLASLLGMAISFLVIFLFILPQILEGKDPVLIAILGSFLIVPTTFYLSHGINKKTTVALIGTFVSLLITGFLAGVFVRAAKIVGFASEEAMFLQVNRGGAMSLRGLFLAGIIIGALGVLDDITVSQAAVVFELKKVAGKFSFKEIYQRAMQVGKDHIASMVNTLVLVYTGASLPLFLLFTDSSKSFAEVVNYEIVASEIIRTLVGSIGLISAVPITTLLAAWAAQKKFSLTKTSFWV